MPTPADSVIRTVDELREVIAPPSDAVTMKLGDGLDEFARDFIAECPFLVLATSAADGRGDASPKGDEAGFVLVEDDHTLVIPDRPGNHLAFGLTNILENPHVGLLFVIPGTTETLRVNGRAELTRDEDLLEQLGARGKAAVLGIRVHVDEVFFHCAKAFIRSHLWKHETWPPKRKVSFGAMFAAKMDRAADEDLVAVIDDLIETDYAENL
ncbi:MAG TPA: MSMEG_1061 family FMN-dependent PPOX-type flavoprotein [Acidimicrobiales bacterium]|nr:MSMEG_1061 family FMN-dependent PPOX-type flavoprotein [Acidimicrobiales bacterium]